MLNTIGVTVRFGKRVLFEDVNIKFAKGNCYGIIGANGAGKSTFLKVLSGELEPSKGEVVLDKGERLSILKQDHFAYEEFRVLDTVIMGNHELYDIMKKKMNLLLLVYLEQRMRNLRFLKIDQVKFLVKDLQLKSKNSCVNNEAYLKKYKRLNNGIKLFEWQFDSFFLSINKYLFCSKINLFDIITKVFRKRS